MKREISLQHPGKEKQLESTRYTSRSFVSSPSCKARDLGDGEAGGPTLSRGSASLGDGGGDTPPSYRQGSAGLL